MPDVPWLAELREAKETVHGPTLVYLATLGKNGSPRVRTLVVRGVEEDGSLLSCSDARSDKDDQLKSDPRAEGVLWFEEPKVQFRLRGECRVVSVGDDDDALRERVWKKLKDSGRMLFAWPEPGGPRADDSQFVEGVGEDAAVPDNFEVLRLSAAEVDRLDLSQTPHRRTIWTPDGGEWSGREVNP